MNVNELSNQDANKWIFRIKKMTPMAWSEGEDCVYRGIDNDGEKFDWINDDALAHRLMIDSGISITCFLNIDDKLIWLAQKCPFIVDNINPNRAIAETFILMNQHKEV